MPFISNDGIKIHYEVDGSGPPLVMLHGLSDSIESWYEFGYVKRLREEFQLILIEPRGHGNSDKPHESSAYDLKLMAGDVLAVIDELRLKQVYFYGYSMGCRIGFELARVSPERIHAFIMGGHHPYFFDLQVFRNIFQGGLNSWLQVLENSAGPLSAAMRARILGNDIDALRAIVAEDRPDMSGVLSTMTMRCRLFAGNEDDRYSKVKEAAFELPNGDFIPLVGLNHFQGVFRGDLVAPLIAPYIILLINEVERGRLRKTMRAVV